MYFFFQQSKEFFLNKKREKFIYLKFIDICRLVLVFEICLKRVNNFIIRYYDSIILFGVDFYNKVYLQCYYLYGLFFFIN